MNPSNSNLDSKIDAILELLEEIHLDLQIDESEIRNINAIIERSKFKLLANENVANAP